MDVNTLRSSLDRYHQKLARLMNSVSQNSDQKLQMVIGDMLELIALTEEQIKQAELISEESDSHHSEESVKEIESELVIRGQDDGHEEQFVFTGESCSRSPQSNEESTTIGEYTHKVMAPYRHMNGTIEYLTAFYFSSSPVDEIKQRNRSEKVRVFYLTPLSRAMNPCGDFPNCQRKLCKFSHGIDFQVSQLRRYSTTRSHRNLKVKCLLIKLANASLLLSTSFFISFTARKR